MSTRLLYMEDMQQLECEAQVISIEQADEKTIVVLDQTVFYPQGGGQPYDTGSISGRDSRFLVQEVRYLEGRVLHIGNFEGPSFVTGEIVKCCVDEDQRKLHTRLHSAGHVLDMAVSQLGYDWIPGKGFHFPEGPYVEYQGTLGEEPKDNIIAKLTQKISEILDRELSTSIRFVPIEEMSQLCRHVPDYLPKDKPSRVVMYDDFAVPCGGTHVAKLKDIGSENIRKIKSQSGTIRVSYAIS